MCANDKAGHSPNSTHTHSNTRKGGVADILLTDGMVDIDKDPEKNRAEWRRIVDDLMPKLKDAGVRVHTIALSKNADKDLMDRLIKKITALKKK